jgi:nitrogen permease regulator 3-like protein
LRALEWLLRHGFVMHLRTFVWLRVPKQIKRAVFNDMQLEEEMSEVKIRDHEDGKVKNADMSTDNTSKQKSAEKMTGKSPIVTSGYETPGATSMKNEILDTNLDPGQDSILHDPGRASGLERRWMARMVDAKPAEWAPLFNKIVKYFNGRESLDKVCALEHISRQDMRRFVSVYEDYLFVVRHW